MLLGYDSAKRNYLISGFTNGFPLHFEGSIEPKVCKNLVSFDENIAEGISKINKEIKLGRIVGPFPTPPFHDFHMSPLGLVPKRDGKFRLIHHLSYPEGGSVNDGIPEIYSKVKYQTLDDAINIINRLGRGCLIAKADIEDAFRLIPIQKQDHHLLGFSVNGLYYHDRSLPMGSSSACLSFEKFSSAIHWILNAKYDVPDVVHILDDFTFFGPAHSEQCSASLASFLNLAKFVNVPIKQSKTVLPSTTVVLYGIEVDTLKWEMRLPSDKLNKLKSLLSEVTGRRKITVRTLQSLLGHLNFACLVVVPGRTFMRRLQNLLCKLKNPKPLHWVRLSSEAQADIDAWSLFVNSHFHGKSLLLNTGWTESNTIQLFTDAAQSIGCAAVFKSHWFAIQWPVSWKQENIATLELFPITVAVEIWGHLWRNHQICFNCDNMAVVEVINKQTAKDKRLMCLIRKLVLSAMKFNINMKAKHVQGISNTKADLLSRSQVHKARQLFPDLDSIQTQVPDHLLPQP